MEASESGMEKARPETEAAEVEAEVEQPSGGMAFEAAPGVEVSRTGELVAAAPLTTTVQPTMQAAEDKLADDDPPLLLPAFARPILPFARPFVPLARPFLPFARPVVPLVRPFPYVAPYAKVVPVPTYVVPQYYPVVYGGYPYYVW